MIKSGLHPDNNLVYWKLGIIMENSNNKGGRPSGRIKTAKIEIALEPTVKAEFMQLLRAKGKTASVQIGEWIIEYIESAKTTEGSK